MKLSARRQKYFTVYIGVGGYLAMVITQDFMIGVWTKLFAELLRIAFYRETKAPDMAMLSLFFVCSSLITIVKEFLP